MNSLNLSLEDIQKPYLKKIFIKKLYFYYINRGYYNIIYTHLSNIFSGLFMILYIIFLLNCIDWNQIIRIKTPTQISKIININNFFKFNIFIYIFFITYLIILIFRIHNLIKDINNYKDIKLFYNEKLNIKDFDINLLKWNKIIQKLTEYYNDEDITIYYINNKITAIDNYFISLVNKDIIKTKNISKILEWNIKYCFISSLFKDNKISNDFLVLNKKFYKEIEFKILCVVILNFIFMPFIINYLTFYNLFNYGELFYNKPKFIFSKSWSLLGKWKFRNYNELPHEFNERILKSYEYCNEYSEQFKNKIFETIIKFLLFILSSIFITMVFFSIINDKLLLNLYIFDNKQLFWFIGIIGSVIAIMRSNISEKTNYYPKEKMKELQKIINYIPNEWQNINNKEFFSFYNYKFILFIKEFFYTINTPFYLFYLYFNYKQICIGLNECTINSPKYGHINKYSLFDNNLNIDKKQSDSIETFKNNNNL